MIQIMIKSMTGFGRSEQSTESKKIIVELKAVNHRYCDLSIKMPKKISFFEVAIRNLLKEYIQRGKVDVFITYEDYAESKVCVKYNEDIAAAYMENLKKLGESFQLKNDVTVTQLSRYPEVFTLEEQAVDEDELWALIEKAIRDACEKFVQTRIAEGEHLLQDIFMKLDAIEEKITFVEQRNPEIVNEYREKLTTKVNELLGDTQVDESVLATEIIVFADKICVDEETVRLRSHIKNMKNTLLEGGSIGRKLDFIAQEMNREANTILSKANDLDVSNTAIDIKTEIEKIREQIQNIE